MKLLLIRYPHLLACLVAPLALVMGVVAAPEILQKATQRGPGVLVVKNSLQKDLGLDLQRRAFQDPHVLPVYGSSELSILPFPNRPDLFFANAPTGFQVSTVGRGGNTSLVIAEKLAALGSEITGKKVVILVSFPWFNRFNIRSDGYAGNFSELQAASLATSSELDYSLRHRFAERMLKLPDTFKDRPLLANVLYDLRSPVERETGHPMLRTWKLRGQAVWLASQDRACVLLDLLENLPQSSPVPDLTLAKGIPGKRAALIPDTTPVPPRTYAGKPGNDDHFTRVLPLSKEWADFELLLDTLAQLRAKPLFVCIPLDGSAQDKLGTDQSTRSHLFYNRLAQLCAARGFAYRSLREYEYDPQFLNEGKAHFSNRGWAVVNLLLDDFYHDALESKVPSLASIPFEGNGER